MRKSRHELWNTCALSLCVVLLAGTPLLGQRASAQKETVSLKTLPTKFDKDYGAAIARIGVGNYGEGRLYQIEATLVEIPAGGKLAPRKLLAEEIVYIISGNGYTTMWPAGATSKKERYDWATGDVLSPSLNVWREHVNASSTEPARFLSMTSAPLTKNLFGAVPSSDDVFEDRWKQGVMQKPENVPDGKWSTGQGDISLHDSVDRGIMAVGHHFPDMVNGKMGALGPGRRGFNIRPTGDTNPGGASMAGNRLFEWQNREELVQRTFGSMHDHRHPWEVVYLCIKGEMQLKLKRVADFETEKLEPERLVTWKDGDLMIVEANEYHTHASKVPGSRFLQFKLSGYFYRVGSSIPQTRGFEEDP